MQAVIVRTYPAKRGETGICVVAPIEGLEILVRCWRPNTGAPWQVLPNQGNISISTIAKLRIEEILNS
jgi:hypothetical protein